MKIQVIYFNKVILYELLERIAYIIHFRNIFPNNRFDIIIIIGFFIRSVFQLQLPVDL